MMTQSQEKEASASDQLASAFMLPPLAGLVWLYFISQKPLIFAMDAMSTCGMGIFLGSAILVGVDAGRLGFGSEDAEGWWQKQSPGAWGVACALLWFPMYFAYAVVRVKRGGSNRVVGVWALSLFFLLAYAGMYALLDEKLSSIRSAFGS